MDEKDRRLAELDAALEARDALIAKLLARIEERAPSWIKQQEQFKTTEQRWFKKTCAAEFAREKRQARRRSKGA